MSSSIKCYLTTLPPPPEDPGPGEARKVFFDPSDDGYLGRNDLLGAPNAISILGWMEWDSYNTIHAMAVTVGHSVHAHWRGSSTNRARVHAKVRAALGDPGTGAFTSITYDASLLGIGKFCYVIVVDPVTTQKIELWIGNGTTITKVAEAALPEGVIDWDAANQVTRFFNHTSGGWPLGGQKYSAMAISRGATEAEIEEFNTANSDDMPDDWDDVIGRWPIDEGTGLTAADSEGSNDLTIVEGTWEEGEPEPLPAPTLLLSSPADNAVDVAPATNFTDTYDQDVLPGTGAIEVYETAGDTLVESIDVETDIGIGPGQVSFSGASVTTRLTNALNNSTAHYRKIAVTAIKNVEGTPFAGITDETSLNFTTAAAPPAAPGWWLIPEHDISWYPQEARPRVMGEQFFRNKGYDIGPRDAPEPDALQVGATVVSTMAALQSAVNAADPGDVIALEGGTHFFGTLSIPSIGTSGLPVIIRSNPNDEAKAIIFSGYQPFVTPNTGQWELFDAAKKIWRSTSTFAIGGVGSWAHGHLIRASDGAVIYLFPYGGTAGARFFASHYGGIPTNPGYVGPGTYHDGTHLYIRMENPDEFQSAGEFNIFEIDVDDDPNLHVIYASPNGSYPIHITGSAAFLRFEDIVTWGDGFRATAGNSGCELLRCEINSKLGGFSMRFGNYSNFLFRYGSVRMYFGGWLDRDEHKNTTRGYRTRTHGSLWGNNDGTATNIWFEDSRMTDLSDGMFGGGTSGTNWGSRRCYQRYIDDVTQFGGSSHTIEVARNHITGVPVGMNQGGDSPFPGRFWIHHNVFDLDHGTLWLYAGLSAVPRRSRGCQQTHGSIGNHPAKLYNNTIIGGGYQVLRTAYKSRTSSNSSGVPHYSLNNVLYQCNTRVPDTSITGGGEGQTDRDIRVDGATERHNGNAWGRDTPHGGANLLSVRRSPTDQTTKAWVSLAAFKADTSWSQGGTYNFETNGVDITEKRDAFVDFANGDFQPALGSSIVGMTPIDLTALGSTHGWNLAPERTSDFVGAIPPEEAP